MDEKDKRIAELESENAKLKAEKNKKKKKDKTKFALSNLDLFKPTLETIKKQDRYIFTRGKQQVIKINEFIRDLLVAKIKLESSLPDSQIGSRLSMDEASLIKFLGDSRVKKVGAGRKKTSVKQAEPKPTPEIAAFYTQANPIRGVDKMISDNAPPVKKEKKASDPSVLARYKARGFPYDDLYSAEADAWFLNHPDMPIPD